MTRNEATEELIERPSSINDKEIKIKETKPCGVTIQGFDCKTYHRQIFDIMSSKNNRILCFNKKEKVLIELFVEDIIKVNGLPKPEIVLV